MNKKITFVIGSLVRGGAEKVIFSLANEYVKKDWDVSIIILLTNKIEFEIDSRIKIINFTGNCTSRVKRIFYWLKSLRHFFKSHNPDIIVSFVARINVLVLLSAKRKKHKKIISERNDPRYDGRGLITKILVRLLYPKADKIVFQTLSCKKMFTKKIQQKSCIIPNPINITEFAPNKPRNNNLIIAVGRLAPQKSHQILIEAMNKELSHHQ